MTPSPRRSSIAARLFFAVGVPAAIVVVALGVFSWRTTAAAVEQSLKRELAASVAAAATTVSVRSAALLLALEGDGAKESNAYRRTVTRLKQIATFTGSTRVILVDDEERVLADDAGALAIGSPAPRLALDRVELATALAGTPAVSVPFRAADGRRFLAAYAALPRPEDEAADAVFPRFVLAMEAPAAALDATDVTARRIGGLVALAVVGVFSLALVVARTITRSLLRLAGEAERLGRGELQAPLSPPPGNDEVAALGRTLEAMRSALVDRDAERQMMLAGIAHEVRNPLGGMELFTGLLEEGIAELPAPVAGEAKAELASHAGRVRKELRYLTDVVSSFLAFARDTPLHKEAVDVAAMLEDVASLCRRDGAARIEVAASAAGSAQLDRSRIKQALLNLVDNAIAATPTEGTVTLAAERDDTGHVLLTVADTGRGMDADTLARAWTPFFTTKEKGSGLGLPLVKKLAKDHGGDASVRSTPGVGTVVQLRLPGG